MPTYDDERGVPVTAANAGAVERLNATVREYLEYRTSTGETLKQALQHDPDLPLAYCMKGYFLMLLGTRATHDGARKALAAARAKADGLAWRERAHLEALDAWTTGDSDKAGRVWDEILVEHPRDVLALRLHHFNAFWSGRSSEVRDGPARVLGEWSEDTPGYGSVLGMHAFGLEECNDYAAAEAAGRRAVELNGDDLWAIHAVAHVYEMQGRLDDGARWLSQPPGTWADRNPFRNHLWWHTALFPLERGDTGRVLEIYDAAVVPEDPGFYLDVQNAASLLFRLEVLGADVGERWQPLADIAEERLDDHVLPFTDVHFMLALAADGRDSAARALIASLDDFALRRGETAAATMRPVTIPLCEAVWAYGRGDFDRTVELMWPLRSDYVRLGASHAQRDLFNQLLIEAAMGAGRWKLARALLCERAFCRPNSRGTWRKYARVLDRLGETDAAAVARKRAEAVGA